MDQGVHRRVGFPPAGRPPDTPTALAHDGRSDADLACPLGKRAGVWYARPRRFGGLSQRREGAQSMHALNGADTAFVLISAALVALMTPGLAFFYGGLVRRKNFLAIMMQSFISMGVVTTIWVFFGYSLASRGNVAGGLIGNLELGRRSPASGICPARGRPTSRRRRTSCSRRCSPSSRRRSSPGPSPTASSSRATSGS